MTATGGLLSTRLLEEEECSSLPAVTGSDVLEHQPIPHISYAYEWPFELLKRAALAHIDLHLALLEKNFSLVDGNSYNMQFLGVNPKFIDIPSVVPYQDGEPWLGYAQFCEQFIAPLCLSADIGVPHQAWLRGSPNGISLQHISRLLPYRKRLSFNRFVHIMLHGKMQARHSATSENVRETTSISRSLNKKSQINFLTSLRHLVDSFHSNSSDQTEWEDYENLGHYGDDAKSSKFDFVQMAVKAQAPDLLWDLGCNSGEYAELSLSSGASYVVGFDLDLGALDRAVIRSNRRGLNFLPLYSDALNPSPNQGWAEQERSGFKNRSKPDMILALALIHHIVISGNVPLDKAVDWMTSLAPSGVIEFVTKEDQMVKRLLSNRVDHFLDYNLDSFESYLSVSAKIVKKVKIQNGSRVLYFYERS